MRLGRKLVLTAIHDTLGEYERAQTVCERACDESEDAQRPADPKYVHAIMLITTDNERHHGPTEIRYARRHCPDDRYVWVALEFCELRVIVLEHTERYGKAWSRSDEWVFSKQQSR